MYAELQAGQPAEILIGRFGNDDDVWSSNRGYRIRCGSGLKLYRMDLNQLVGETSITPLRYSPPSAICSTYIKWASDESAAAIVASDHSLYVWRVSEPAPRKISAVVAYPDVAWSPDGQRLAIVSAWEGGGPKATIAIIDTRGQKLSEFQVDSGGQGPILGWLTNGVIIRYSRDDWVYYDRQTGQRLFDWT